MGRGELLKKCEHIKTLLRTLKLNKQPEPYRSIAIDFLNKALAEVGRELLELDRIHGGGNCGEIR